jgi:hypothetical protein
MKDFIAKQEIKRMLSSNEEKEKQPQCFISVYWKHVNYFQTTVTVVTGKLKVDASPVRRRVVKVFYPSHAWPSLRSWNNVLERTKAHGVCLFCIK